MLNELVSQGYKSARTLNEKPKLYKTSFTMVITTNIVPRIEGDTEGTYRRIVIVPFEFRVKDGEEKEYIYLMMLFHKHIDKSV